MRSHFFLFCFCTRLKSRRLGPGTKGCTFNCVHVIVIVRVHVHPYPPASENANSLFGILCLAFVVGGMRSTGGCNWNRMPLVSKPKPNGFRAVHTKEKFHRKLAAGQLDIKCLAIFSKYSFGIIWVAIKSAQKCPSKLEEGEEGNEFERFSLSLAVSLPPIFF